MKNWRLLSTVSLTGLLIACGGGPQVTSSQLPLRRVVVYRNGVGYFERRGHVSDAEITFKMRKRAVGDFLATLAIVEQGGSSVRSASFPIDVEDKYEPAEPPLCEPEPGKCVNTQREPRKERNPLRKVALRLDGKEHDLAIGYVAETPVWRPSYRVVIAKNGKAELQSWGIVQNLSGENWKNVDLVLVAGAPLAFRSSLGDPVTPERPTVTDAGEVIAAVPQGVTSLEKTKEGEVSRYVPEEQAPPPPPAPMTESGYLRGEGAMAAKMEEAADAAADEPMPAGAPGKPRSGGATLRYSKKAAAPKALSSGPMGLVSPMPSPSYAAAVAPSAPKNMSILAGVAVEAGATRYSVPYPITVPDESATMVLLANQTVPGESVFLFAPDGGVSDSVRYPFRVARFTNATQGLLERGPIAVFEKGSFLGQGMLESLPPGATATVPFALERGISVEQSTRFDERSARLYKVEHGALTIERDAVTLTTYKMTNGTKSESKILVKHPRQSGTRLFRPPTGTDDNAAQGNALVPMTIAANGKAELVVDERMARQQSASWLEPLAEDAVRGYLEDSRADSKMTGPLKSAWQIRNSWKALVDEQSKLQTERNELERNLYEIRQNLRAIEKNAQAADLRQKLTRKLGESSSRADQITKRLIEVEVAMREQEVRFRDAIQEVTILSAPTPKD